MTTHLCPIGDSGITPCCHKTPLELPATDQLSIVEAVDCQDAPTMLTAEELRERWFRDDAHSMTDDEPARVRVVQVADGTRFAAPIADCRVT